MDKTYTYDPAKIKDCGRDKMRFELGDTMVEGGAETTALTDEEITAILETYPRKWKRAKLALVESICRRFSYEVDTKVGPLSLSLQGRAEMWKQMYDDLRKSVGNSASVSVGVNPAAVGGNAYFSAGMMDNPSGKGAGRP